MVRQNTVLEAALQATGRSTIFGGVAAALVQERTVQHPKPMVDILVRISQACDVQRALNERLVAFLGLMMGDDGAKATDEKLQNQVSGSIQAAMRDLETLNSLQHATSSLISRLETIA